jgi:hypothetical protein
MMPEGDLTEFKIRVDGGEEQAFKSSHGEYCVAIMDAFGRLALPYPCTVEIWCDHLLPDYGPYRYQLGDFVDVYGNQYISPAVMALPSTEKGHSDG